MMRALILLAALLAGTAHAETIAFSATQAGGQIRLTDEKSNCGPGLFFFYTTTTSGEVLPGCWKMLDGDVYAKYADGSIRLYPSDGFTMKKAAPQKQKQRGEML